MDGIPLSSRVMDVMGNTLLKWEPPPNMQRKMVPWNLSVENYTQKIAIKMIDCGRETTQEKKILSGVNFTHVMCSICRIHSLDKSPLLLETVFMSYVFPRVIRDVVVLAHRNVCQNFSKPDLIETNGNTEFRLHYLQTVSLGRWVALINKPFHCSITNVGNQVKAFVGRYRKKWLTWHVWKLKATIGSGTCENGLKMLGWTNLPNCFDDLSISPSFTGDACWQATTMGSAPRVCLRNSAWKGIQRN